jgi:uncharacterized protein
MIPRELSKALIEDSSQFFVIAVLGPRQSGKTTLVKATFPYHQYVSLENTDIRDFASTDPRQFLRKYRNDFGIILDEIQHVPTLLSYIQTIVDEEQKPGSFIITGSQNFLVNEAITQSLAGRVAILTLLPFSISELMHTSLLPDAIDEAIFKGGYPRIYADSLPVHKLYTNYIRTYVERDVRQIRNIENLNTFQRFMRLCAGRIGQLLTISSLANDCGIEHKTAKSWLSLLEASYVIFFLYPYYNNLGKRVIKSPKLYFVDTGIVCSLLRLRSSEEVSNFYMRGSLVENFILADLLKQYHNHDLTPSLYFWKDQTHEIDCIIDEPKGPIALEVKSGETITSDYFKQITYWSTVTGLPPSHNYVVYTGSDNQIRTQGTVIGWKSVGNLIEDFI